MRCPQCNYRVTRFRIWGDKLTLHPKVCPECGLNLKPSWPNPLFLVAPYLVAAVTPCLLIALDKVLPLPAGSLGSYVLLALWMGASLLSVLMTHYLLWRTGRYGPAGPTDPGRSARWQRTGAAGTPPAREEVTAAKDAHTTGEPG